MNTVVRYFLPNQHIGNWGMWILFSSWSPDAVPTGRWKLIDKNGYKTMEIEVNYVGYTEIGLKKFLWLIPYDIKYELTAMSCWLEEREVDITTTTLMECSSVFN